MGSHRVLTGIAVALLVPCPPASLHRAQPDFPGENVQNRPQDLSSPAIVPKDGVIQEGEDLLYEVSWAFFKLGTIRLKTLQTIEHHNAIRYSATASIDSYEGLPFVNLHSIIHSEMDSSFSSRSARALEQKQGEWWGMHYRYDSTRSHCFVEETWQKDLKEAPYKRSPPDTLTLPRGFVQDGLSLAYFARAHVLDRDTLSVPVIAYGKLGWTTFHFDGQRGTEEIDAYSAPIRVVEFDGWLDVQGIFGLTGDFRGWFSDDSAAIPIKAQFRVILGHVTVKLIGWERKGWIPPS
jgi:hypothetical protein